MPNDETAHLFNEIGTILSGRRANPAKGIFLYAYLSTNVVGASVFLDENDSIECIFPPDDLNDPLLDLWEQEAPEDRWVEMEYVLRGDKVDVTFIYADKIDPEEDFLDRRERAVVRHFGNKPIVYPSLDDLPDNGDTHRFDL